MSSEVRKFILGADIDNTLVPTKDDERGKPRTVDELTRGYAALGELVLALKGTPNLVAFGSVTGLTIASHDAYAAEISALGAAVDIMKFKITSVGTAVHLRMAEGFVQDTRWPQVHDWNPDGIGALMDKRLELEPQDASTRSTYKLSYYVTGVPDKAHAAYVGELQTRLARVGLAAQIIFSGGRFLDFLPVGVDKGPAFTYASTLFADEGEPALYRVAVGDSMNDAGLLAAADLAILPANAHASLRQWAEALPSGNLYVAEQNFAAGVLEGLEWANVL